MNSIEFAVPHCVINSICDALTVLHLGGTVAIAEYPTLTPGVNHAQAMTQLPDGTWTYLTRHYSDNIVRTWGKNSPCGDESKETRKSLEQFLKEQAPILGLSLKGLCND